MAKRGQGEGGRWGAELSERRAAAYLREQLGLDRWTYWVLRRAREREDADAPPWHKVGTHYRYRRDALDAWAQGEPTRRHLSFYLPRRLLMHVDLRAVYQRLPADDSAAIAELDPAQLAGAMRAAVITVHCDAPHFYGCERRLLAEHWADIAATYEGRRLADDVLSLLRAGAKADSDYAYTTLDQRRLEVHLEVICGAPGLGAWILYDLSELDSNA